MKIKKTIAVCAARIVTKMAKAACDSASILGGHQPKEPQNIEAVLRRLDK